MKLEATTPFLWLRLMESMVTQGGCISGRVACLNEFALPLL